MDNNISIQPIHTFILIFILLFTMMRFINIDADLPGDLEEYSREEVVHIKSAIDKNITGNWYKDHVFNPVVTSPVLNLIYYTGFSILGMSITTAKLITLCFFILLLIVTFIITKKYFNTLLALLVLLLLSQNYYFYVFSRSTYPVIPMLSIVMLSIFVAGLTDQKYNDYFVGFASVFILFFACLIKLNAVFALPVILYISNLSGRDKNSKSWLIIGQLLLFGILIGGYFYFIKKYYPHDLKQYIKLFINFKNLTTFKLISNNLDQFLHQMPFLFPLVIFLSGLLYIGDRDIRKNPLINISYIWILSYCLVILVFNCRIKYYILPLLIPIYILFLHAIDYLRTNSIIETKEKFVLIIVIISTVLSSASIGSYLLNSQDTFVKLSSRLKKYIQRKEKDNQEKVIITGDEVKKISLETGINSIVLQKHCGGTNIIEDRLKIYKPQYYVQIIRNPINKSDSGMNLDSTNTDSRKKSRNEKYIYNSPEYEKTKYDTPGICLKKKNIKSWRDDIIMNLYSCKYSN